MAVLNVETDTIASMALSPIGHAMKGDIACLDLQI
jgi:hypothetical protein